MPKYGGDAFPKKKRDKGRACMSALLGIDFGDLERESGGLLAGGYGSTPT